MSTRSARSRIRQHRRYERGVGVLTTALAAAIMLAIVLLAAHVLLALQRRSIVEAVAFDAARSVARKDGASAGEAESRARSLLHDATARFEWNENADTVDLRVVASSPLILRIGPLRGLASIDRTVHVRREIER